MRAIRGVLAVEGVQTGDGRVIAEGAVTWVDPPLPFAWLQEEMHGDLLSGATQVGTIDTITRVGGDVQFTGTIDDENNDDGAALVSRMEAGTAALGNRIGVSIDPDDYEVELILMDSGDEEGEDVLVAAGGITRTGRVLRVIESSGPLPITRPAVRTAAAGDPDPGPGGGDDGTTLFEASADELIERYTRLRIRGATACNIAAFDGAYAELDGEATSEEPPADEQPAETAAAPPLEVQTTAPAAAIPVRPPLAWFTDPAFGVPGEDMRLVHDELEDVWGCPFSVMADGRVFGHLALWGTCHIGYPDTCLEPPPSMSAYAHFLHGALETAEGEHVPVGQITLSGGHAELALSATAAMAHYDNTDSAVADVSAGEDEYGVWVAGALRPNVSDEQLRVLRASPLSGDWRPIGGSLELVAALCVNVQGYRVPRARARVAGGSQVALVAAGAAALARMRERESNPLAAVMRRLRVLEMRTEPLIPMAAQALRQQIA